MKNYERYTLAGAGVCLVGSCAIIAFELVVILLTFRGLGPGEPFADYQWLDLPILSVALPALGMLLLAASRRVFLGKHRVDLHMRDFVVKPAHPPEVRNETLPKAA